MRTFEDFKTGETFETPARTVTGALVDAFAGLTGDMNPLHTDAVAAAKGRFGERVAHGMLTVSLATGLWFRTGAFEGVILSGLDRVRFLAPVHLGDTVRVRATVEATEDRGGYGLVVVANEVVNADGETVCVFEARLAVEKARPGEEGPGGGGAAEDA